MITQEEVYPIGKIQKTHALKGELNMIIDIDPEYFLEGNPLIVDIDGILVPHYVDSIRKKGSTSYLVKIEGVEKEEDALPFVNKEVYMLKKDLEDWVDEDFIDSESLIGFQIFDSENGKKIGEIIHIDDSTSNILWIVESDKGDEIYIPASEEFIKEIDENNRAIKMMLPDGLVDLN